MEINIVKSKTSSKMSLNESQSDNNYYFFEYIDISVGDPISSLILADKYVIIGTMFGKIQLFILNKLSQNSERLFTLENENLEYISGLSYNEESNILYACIGDDEIKKFNLSNQIMNNKNINLYENSAQHIANCDNTYVLMGKEDLLKVQLFSPELELVIKNDVYIEYEIIHFDDITNNKNYKGKIKSTNYYVPLYFNDFYFCWVEYLNDKEDRNLCVEYLLKEEIINDVKYKFKVDKNYGHISHAKLLSNNRIIIVHQLNKCEIRKISEKFELLESFEHIGDEIYAIDIFYHEGNTFYNENLNEKKSLKNKINTYEIYDIRDDNIYKAFKDDKLNENKQLKGKKLQKIDRNKKIGNTGSIELKTDSLNLLKNNAKNSKIDELSTVIITLDIDGNVNEYENKNEKTLFNLYNIENIHQDHKDKKFFNMGYVYYIKTDLNNFCITTDHGCYIIKRNE